MVVMPKEAALLFETAEDKRDYVSIEISGTGIQINASVVELKQKYRPELTERIQREVSAIIDPTCFPSPAEHQEAVAKMAAKIIAKLDEIVEK